MGRNSNYSCPSFWKLLMEDDFNRGIRIPHSFSNHLERRKSPCNYSLITEDKKRSSNRSWRAKLVKKDHYYYMCKKSWPEFVRDHNLKYGDLLLFHLVDKATFQVTPYGADGSKKKLNDDDSSSDDDDYSGSDTTESESDEDVDVKTSTKRRPKRKHKKNKQGGSTPVSSKKVRKSNDEDYDIELSDSDEDDDDSDCGVIRESHSIVKSSVSKNSRRSGNDRFNKEVNANSRKQIEEMTNAEEACKWDHYYDLGVEKPYFISTIKSHNKSFLVVPRPFARATNLDKTDEVVLQWEDGDYKRLLRAKIIERETGRIDIGDGWSEFQKEFSINVGDTCRFTIVNRRDPITFSVHIFRSNDLKSRN